MGPHYYYLSASLPTLLPETYPEISIEGFIALCRRYLNDSCYRELTNAQIEDHDTPPISPLYAEWREFDLDLREQQVMLRAANLAWEVRDHLRREPIPPVFVTGQVQAIFDHANPLTAQKMIFELRWRFLEELDGRFFMRLDNLVVYSLKLQLIEQQRVMTKERGIDTLKAIRTHFASELPGWENL